MLVVRFSLLLKNSAWNLAISFLLFAAFLLAPWSFIPSLSSYLALHALAHWALNVLVSFLFLLSFCPPLFFPPPVSIFSSPWLLTGKSCSPTTVDSDRLRMELLICALYSKQNRSLLLAVHRGCCWINWNTGSCAHWSLSHLVYVRKRREEKPCGF